MRSPEEIRQERIDSLRTERRLRAEIERLEAMVEAGKMSAKVKTDALEAKDAEIERLKAGFKSEESQEYCHNEVTGLHNMADLYEIERLKAVVDAGKDALEKLSRLGNEPHLGNSDGNVIAQNALSKIAALEVDDE